MRFMLSLEINFLIETIKSVSKRKAALKREFCVTTVEKKVITPMIATAKEVKKKSKHPGKEKTTGITPIIPKLMAINQKLPLCFMKHIILPSTIIMK